MSDEKTSFILKCWNKLEGKLAIKTGLAATIGLFLGKHLSSIASRPDSIVSGLWCVLTAIIVLQAHLGGTYKAAWNRFLGVLVGSIIGGIFTSLLGSDAFSLGFGVIFTVLICSLLDLKESYRIASVSTAVIIVLWGLKPAVSPWAFSLFRFLDSCVGILIAVVIAHTLWPFHAVKKMRQNMSESIKTLQKLYSIVIKLGPRQDRDATEYKILASNVTDLLVENRGILEESKPEMLTKSASFDEWTLLINDFDRIFEQIVSLKNTYKQHIQEMFDESLSKEFEKITETTNEAFHKIDDMLRETNSSGESNLGQAIQSLKREMERFRTTHTTRKHDLEVVETYFVFFYGLKTILEILQKIEKRLLKLKEEAD